MLDEIMRTESRQDLVNALASKAVVFFFLLVGHTISLMFFPFVIGNLIDSFDLPFQLMQHSRTVVSTMIGIIIVVLALRDRLPGAILIGLLAIRTPVFSCILYLLAYTLKKIHLK